MGIKSNGPICMHLCTSEVGLCDIELLFTLL